jgi:Tfp pilus assembly protein PilV
MVIPKLTVPKISTQKYKLIAKVLSVVIVAVALLALTGAVVNHYQGEKAEQARVEKQKQEAQVAELNKLRDVNAKWEDAYNTERTNCEKGKNLYAVNLNASQKRLVATQNIPQCGLAVPDFAREAVQ